MRPATGNANVAVADESPMEITKNRVVDEIMHDPITKIRHPYFPDFRICDNKDDAAPNFVIPAFKITVQRNQIALKIGLESQLIDRIALGPAAIEINIEHHFNHKASIHHEFSHLAKMSGKKTSTPNTAHRTQHRNES